MNYAAPIALCCCAATCAAQMTAPPPGGTVRIQVDAHKSRHPISPLIYGVNYGSTQQLRALHATLNRSGGDSADVYNFQQDARNSGRDWYFESYPANRADTLQQYSGGFVALTLRAGADAMLTVPMVGWVAKLGPNRTRLAGFSITKYGLQQSTDSQGFAEAGNGIRVDGSLIHNDPNDAMQPDSLSRESEWVRRMASQSNRIAYSSTHYYLLGNEPSRWHDIHRDVHPEGTHARELADKSIALANAIHAADPAAKVAGPEEWAPVGTRDSGFDQQIRETKSSATPDRETQTGGADLLPWLLAQWKSAGHPVDVVSVHYYPQHGEYGDNVTEAMQLQRNRSTRGLWDRSYHDIDYMPTNTALIPSVREAVDHFYYPGTPIAVTEYSWGAENHMNGATAQADILGIFGREGLYAATRWIVPPDGSPTFLAMRMFRNYDGHGGSFGDTSVSAVAPDVDRVSAFAAERADHALTVMLINKQLHEPAPAEVALTGVKADGNVDVITLSDGRMSQLPSQSYHGATVVTVLPPQSVTLLVIHANGR